MSTTAPSTRRLSALERREQLLDVAKELVGERGFHGVSIEAVAARAEITRPIVYHHFGDLSGLLEALVLREAQRALGQLSVALPAGVGPGDDIRDVLFSAWRGYLEVVNADPATWRLVLMPPEGAPEKLREHIAVGRATVVDHLATLVRPGLGPGRESPDPELEARIFSALAEETARLLLTQPERFPLERIVKHARWLLDQVGSPVGRAADRPVRRGHKVA